jgi:hypothetical protein
VWDWVLRLSEPSPEAPGVLIDLSPAGLTSNRVVHNVGGAASELLLFNIITHRE